MTYAKRTDENHKDIVKALRELGWTVVNLHRVGQGCPDILIGAGFYTLLGEIKTEKGALNATQLHFHRTWMGSKILVLRDPEQAVKAVREQQRELWRRSA